MKDNGPVTGREQGYDAATMRVSMTGPKGRITCANPAFVQVSGFTLQALNVKAHNLVRHPDMPADAAAAESLEGQAGRLVDAVNPFKLPVLR